jgi:hypothetical protein
MEEADHKYTHDHLLLSRIRELVRKLEWIAANCAELPQYKRLEIAEALALARSIANRKLRSDNMPDLSNWGQCGALRDDVPYGEHIQLTCVHHPALRWSTKNIAPIGARHIFYNLRGDPNMGLECNCPMSDLVVVSGSALSESSTTKE